MVVVDDQGNYGKVTTIEAINELQKYKITRSVQGSLGDEMVSFVFPKDKGAAKITIKSLFEEIINATTFDSIELGDITSKILSEIHND